MLRKGTNEACITKEESIFGCVLTSIRDIFQVNRGKRGGAKAEKHQGTNGSFGVE